MTAWVTRLLAANIIVFFLQYTVLRGYEGLFVFIPAAVLVRPWTVVTYMFLHQSITHLLFNMLGLYFFGPRVEERLGSNHFLAMYLTAGITGAALMAVFAPRTATLGASGAVFGVMLAYARFWPRDRILVWGIIPVEAWLLVIITAGMALVSGLSGSMSGVADFAHLGGFVGAWLYLAWLGRWRGTKHFRTRVVEKVTEPALLNWRKVDVNKAHEVNRDELNRILDKINKKGLNSLTGQEKTFLLNFVPPDDRKPPPVS